MTSKAQIDISDFLKLDLRVGTITDAYPNEGVRKPAYVLHIDFGQELGLRKSSAGITSLYSTEELIGTQVIAVVNFPARQIAKMQSTCLVLGVVDNGKDVVLLRPDKPVLNGLCIA